MQSVPFKAPKVSQTRYIAFGRTNMAVQFDDEHALVTVDGGPSWMFKLRHFVFSSRTVVQIAPDGKSVAIGTELISEGEFRVEIYREGGSIQEKTLKADLPFDEKGTDLGYRHALFFLRPLELAVWSSLDNSWTGIDLTSGDSVTLTRQERDEALMLARRAALRDLAAPHIRDEIDPLIFPYGEPSSDESGTFLAVANFFTKSDVDMLAPLISRGHYSCEFSGSISFRNAQARQCWIALDSILRDKRPAKVFAFREKRFPEIRISMKAPQRIPDGKKFPELTVALLCTQSAGGIAPLQFIYHCSLKPKAWGDDGQRVGINVFDVPAGNYELYLVLNYGGINGFVSEPAKVNVPENETQTVDITHFRRYSMEEPLFE